MQTQLHAIFEKPHVQDVFSIFTKAGVEVRVVGGAVRDALLEREVHDIDMAVACNPAEATRILEPHAIVKPTGLKFGTITVIFPHNHFQITSLRKDVKTHGRHADVIFGGTFEEDALRRDFTINALYLDAQGVIHDFFNGMEDLTHRHVRFIGDATTRIKEDYLRILRFFRMKAYFGRGKPDKDALSACTALKGGLKRLSKERIRLEFFKILTAPHVETLLPLMYETGVLDVLCDHANIESFLALVALEEKYTIEHTPLRRLVALYPTHRAEDLDEAFILMRREYRELKQIEEIGKNDSVLSILYHYGKDAALDYMLLHRPQSLNQALPIIATFIKPTFPITAKHLIECGLSGKELGDALNRMEQAWLESDFKLTKEELLETAKPQN